MKIYNAFGIKPTNTYTSAGTDYYIPNLMTPYQINKAYEAFEKSYKKTPEEIKTIVNRFEIVIEESYSNLWKPQIPNLVHLYLALYDPTLEDAKMESLYVSIKYFMSEFVVYDPTNNKVGIKLKLNDTLFINSGIKIALDTVLEDQTVYPFQNDTIKQLRMIGIGVAGLYVNKSGKGNAGFDVRACLVDEDYSGYVHLSQAYTKDLIEDGQNIVYCGDKLTQMMLLPVFHTEYEECDENEYNKLMAESQRGDKGFGSSDVKH